MSGRPKMCASCGKLMGVGNECPYCGADNSKVSLRVKRAVAQRGGSSGHAVTLFFLGANIFMYLLAIVVGGFGESHGFFGLLPPNHETLWVLGIQEHNAVAAGDWWRIITPIFMHLSIIHLLFNCYVLWVVGRYVEHEFGGRLTFLIYMGSGILGFVASHYAHLGGAGASGAVSGLVGCILVRRWLVDGNFRHPAAMYALQLTVLTAILGFLMPMINNVAHGVGFVTGAAFAFVLTRVKLSRVGALVMMALTAGTAIVTVVAMGAMVLALGRASIDELSQAWQCAHGGIGSLETAEIEPASPSSVAAQTEGAARARAGSLRGLSVAKARQAVACFEKLGDLPSELEPFVPPLRASLEDAIITFEQGDSGGLAAAARRYVTAQNELASWLEQNAPRYGGRFGFMR